MNALSDFTTLVRRNFRHAMRTPLALFNALVVPVFLIFMMVYVFGGAFSVGGAYIDYVTPGLIITAIGYGISATAIAVNADMTTGFIDRLRVMAVSRAAVLGAHVVLTTLRSLVAITLIVAIALAIGFRPSATFAQWLGVIGLVVLTVVALSWLAVAFGLAAGTPESAGMAAVPLMLLPFLSSAFVPAGTMGPGVRQFAEYQPFTPIIETLRGLLTGTPSAGTAVTAVAWCLGLTLAGYLWARANFTKRA